MERGKEWGRERNGGKGEEGKGNGEGRERGSGRLEAREWEGGGQALECIPEPARRQGESLGEGTEPACWGVTSQLRRRGAGSKQRQSPGQGSTVPKTPEADIVLGLVTPQPFTRRRALCGGSYCRGHRPRTALGGQPGTSCGTLPWSQARPPAGRVQGGGEVPLRKSLDVLGTASRRGNVPPAPTFHLKERGADCSHWTPPSALAAQAPTS